MQDIGKRFFKILKVTVSLYCNMTLTPEKARKVHAALKRAGCRCNDSGAVKYLQRKKITPQGDTIELYLQVYETLQ